MKKILMVILIFLPSIFLVSCDQGQGVTGDFVEGTYYAVDYQTSVSCHVVVDETGSISSVLFDQAYQNTSLYTLGDAYILESGNSWRDEAHYLSEYIVRNQGWKDITLETIDITGMTALTAPDNLIEINYDLSDDDIAYVTLDIDGLALSWNEAIKQASTTNVGVIENIPTSLDWLEANKPPYEYMDGIYYGADTDHGYIARIEIENGYIVDVVFDAITAVNTRIIWNDNNTPADTSDDYPEIEIVSMSTKQAFEDDLLLVSGTPWREEAEKMSDAIIDKQCWDDSWMYVVSGSHEYFDFTDQNTIDAVAGVTLSIEGFRQPFLEAIEKAIVE